MPEVHLGRGTWTTSSSRKSQLILRILMHTSLEIFQPMIYLKTELSRRDFLHIREQKFLIFPVISVSRKFCNALGERLTFYSVKEVLSPRFCGVTKSDCKARSHDAISCT